MGTFNNNIFYQNRVNQTTRPGQLKIVQSFDPNSQPGGTAFGGNTTIQNGFYAAVNEACTNMQNLCMTTRPLKIGIQFGYGTVNNQTLGATAAGQSQYIISNFYWNQIRQSVVNSALSSYASAAASTLPVADPSGTGLSNVWFMTSANLKAIGLFSGFATDGWVGINSTFTWTWSAATANGTDWDAVGVLMHEITEVLGRARSAGSGSSYYLLDGYCYSAPGTIQINGGGGYISNDAGTTSVRGCNATAGADFGDWNGADGTDCCNAFGSAGGPKLFTTSDKRIMDMLGWQTGGAT